MGLTVAVVQSQEVALNSPLQTLTKKTIDIATHFTREFLRLDEGGPT